MRIPLIFFKEHLMKLSRLLGAIALCAAAVGSVQAATPDELIRPIQDRWAEIKYRQPEKAQAEQYRALAQQARKLAESNPGLAEVLIWEGIVLSSEAGAKARSRWPRRRATASKRRSSSTTRP
jgi:hypothetical protein